MTRWHPDHFHGDAVGVAEANATLRLLLGIRVFGWILAILGLVFLPLVMETAARLANGRPWPW